VNDDDLRTKTGVSEGDLLAGKYRVDRVLGAGGMGVVVAAHHVELDTPVAVKFVLPSLLGQRDVLVRFAREARASAKITNEHVARVFDVGTLENGAPYMVMEFLEGEDLGQWIQRRGPLAVERAVEFVLQACVAVAEAHGLGIVHRDLKPSNLFCVRRSDGQLAIKVLDFGISKVAAGDTGVHDAALTSTSALIGSPAYMSPEQIQNTRDVDGRTDLWSLGVVLFELLSAQQPFPGSTLAEMAVKIAMAEPVPLRSLRSQVPVALEAVVRRCLEKDPARRYDSVASLARALHPFASPRSTALVDRILGIGAGRKATGVAEPESTVDPPQVAPAAFRSARTITAVQDATDRRPEPPRASAARRVATAVAAGAIAIGALAGLALKLRPPALAAAGPAVAGEGTVVQEPPALSSAEPVRLVPRMDPQLVGPASALPATAQASVVPSAAKSTTAPTKSAASATSAPASTEPTLVTIAPQPSSPPDDAGNAPSVSGKMAALTINSIPPSMCFLDGQLLGATPRVGVTVTPGPHVVKFAEIGGPLSKTISVVAAAGETTYATAKLEPLAAMAADSGP
jgi:serine/threonine-protein kinase